MKEKIQKFVGIALALGDIYSDGGTGKINQPLDGAVARFKEVVEYTDRAGSDRLIICTAGYDKNQPRTPNEKRKLSLSEQLYACNYEFGPLPDWELHTEPLCWSTRNEVRIGIKRSIQIGFAGKEELVTVVIASNLTHLIRIWLYAKMYTPKNWNFKLVRARHQFTLLSHLMEIPKFFRDVDYALRVRSRLLRIQAIRSA